jgi:hypothetical protein
MTPLQIAGIQSANPDLLDYKPGSPHWGLIDMTDVDAETAAQQVCENCEKNMQFLPMMNAATHSYRAFAVCCDCGVTMEF